jgi:hypothetical protein
MSALIELLELLEELKRMKVIVDDETKEIKVKKNGEYVIELKFSERRHFEIVKKIVKLLKQHS